MNNFYRLSKLTKSLIAMCCLFFVTNSLIAQVDCPTNTDLGLFSCVNIDDVPDPVNDVAGATSDPYNLTITNATDATRVLTEDTGVIFYCAGDDREVTRTLTVYNDDNFNFQYDAGEEIGVCTFTITTEADTTSPTFEAPVAANTTCSLGYDPNVTGDVTVVEDDNCPVLNTSSFVFFADAIADGSCLGELIVTRSWTSVDPCGNQSDTQTQMIVVMDDEGPVFTVPADITIPCGSDPSDGTLTGTVTDAMDECDPSTINVSGIIVPSLTLENTPCPGFTTYVKRWGAVDNCGNVTTADQTIVVECPADCSNTDPCVGDIVSDPLPGECECQVVEAQVLGCTDPTSPNYNAAANCDDDSCGVFDLALRKTLSTTEAIAPGDDVTFTITIFNQGSITAQNVLITDYLPTGLTLNDSAWADQGDGTATTTIAGPIVAGSEASVTITLNVPEGTSPGSLENIAEITSAEDENGNSADDIDSTPDNDPNNDNLTDDEIDNGGDDEDDHDIAIFEISCTDGCTDPAACNYNPAATCDDGSCIAIPTCNDDPCAGDISVLSADGCECIVVTPQLFGCTNPAACNYNSSANCDDGSCMPVPSCNTDPCIGDVTTLSADECSCEVVEPQVLGCTDSASCNYNPNANCDNGGCKPFPVCNDNPCRGDVTELQDCKCVVVEPQVLGCNDPLADNYNPSSNCNDGSCTYPSPCLPKMRLCAGPNSPLDICLPCILNGSVDAEFTEVSNTNGSGSVSNLNDVNTACFTYTPAANETGVTELIAEFCELTTGQCWSIIIIIDIDPECGDGVPVCPDELELCTNPTTPVEICIDCIDALGYEYTDVVSLFHCSIDDLDDNNQACFTYTPVPLMELYSPDQVTVTYCIPGTNDCHTTIISIKIQDDCDLTPPTCDVNGGTITGGPFTFCVGDGEADIATGVSLSGDKGDFSSWIITDSDGKVLGLPSSITDVDFDGAGSGTCLIWNISYDVVEGLSQGSNAADLSGCYSLSNPIEVNKVECAPSCDVIGGVLSGGPFEFCVGDGIADYVSGITLSGNAGDNTAWVITDKARNILGLPSMLSDVDFDVAGTGVCLIWNISFDDLSGAVVGANVANLGGCYSLSNSIKVNRIECAPSCDVIGGVLSGGPFEFCVGDGIADYVSGITLSGNAGDNTAWVITDKAGNILSLPSMPGAVDFDGAGTGECLIWNVSFDDLSGAVVGANASNLGGCFELSNSILVNRISCGTECPQSINLCTTPTTEIEICIPCIADGSFDAIITDVESLFNCGIDELDDDNQACFTYTPLPMMQNYSPDIVTVKYCTAAGECKTTEIIMEIKVDCDGAAINTLPNNFNEDLLQLQLTELSEKTLNELENAPIIYPIPSGDFINVALKAEIKTANLTIYNSSGQTMKTKIVENSSGEVNTLRLNVANFESGIYYLVAEFGDSIQATQFIKN